jgi:hypothetical protein
MSNIKEAGPHTVTTGLFRGNQHTFVTHRASGKQWVSKSRTTEHNEASLQWLADTIACGIAKFDHNKIVGSCDTRFWFVLDTPVPAPKSEFDALCFIG